MKALVKSHAKRGLWLEDVSVPKLESQEVLIKVKQMAICGTDIHIYEWDKWSQNRVSIPTVIGHEFVGEIVEVGTSVKGMVVGERVVTEGHITCDYCRNCLAGRRHLCVNTVGIGYDCDGGFAEYVAVPAKNVFKVPERISDDVASILDPLGNAVHTALSFDMIGEDVLITGAGPIGILAVAIAQHVGARNVIITDLNEYRLDLARQLGATHAVNIQKESLPEVMNKLGIKHGFDVALEMSGSSKAMEQIVDFTFHGANIALLGVLPSEGTIDWPKVIFKMLTIKGIYGREIFETWYKMTSMLESGLDIEKVITHRFPFEEFEKGFETMLSGQSGKVILEMT
jgi:threonine 3-dehydrogenase